MKIYLSNRFTYDRNSKTFSAEMSDFKMDSDFSMVELMGFGFDIQSSKTGLQVEFRFHHRIRDNEDTDGELVGWVFESTDGGLYGEKFRCIFFND
jgi:hypothetical protein